MGNLLRESGVTGLKQNYPGGEGRRGSFGPIQHRAASAVTLDFANTEFNLRSIGGLGDFIGLKTRKCGNRHSPSAGAQELPRRWRHWLRPSRAGLLGAAGEAPPPGTEPGGSFAAQTHLCLRSSLTRG